MPLLLALLLLLMMLLCLHLEQGLVRRVSDH
jgi:hypothetical protein